MKFLLLLLLSPFLLLAQHNSHKTTFTLSIDVHGLAKSSSSSHTEYKLDDYKLNYSYNYNGSMGMSDAEEHASKKFAHREQRELFHFLEEAKTYFEEEESLEIDDSEQVIKIILHSTYNNKTISWRIKGGGDNVKDSEAYNKILELEDLIRELSRLDKRG